MNVTDLPQQSTHALYDEAMTRYAEMVKSRAQSVYRVADIKHPGIDAIELLVITDRAFIDNRYFFSAIGRLPERYRSLFVHEPFVLPVWSLRTIRYTGHRERALLSGRDILHEFPPSGEVDERWCRILESYCSFAQFRNTVQESGSLPARLMFSQARDFATLLDDAALTLGCGDPEKYHARMDALCSRFFSYANPADGAIEAWNIFCAAFERFERALQEQLPAICERDSAAAARDLARGERECEAFDREYAFRRARDIDGYNHELASMHLPFGHLFPAAAHPCSVRAQDPAVPVFGQVVRNFYRMRKRLTEYAGA